MKSSNPPFCPTKPHQLKYHGQTENDPYFWLRNKEDPDTLKYINAENTYTKKVLSDTKTIQTKLLKEMRARIKEDDSSIPVKIGDYWYYSKYKKGQQYRILCRKKSPKSPEEITLDCNILAKGKPFFSLGTADYSPNGQWLAFSTDTNGSEKYTIQFKNLQTGKILPEKIPQTSGSSAWTTDNKNFFYIQLNDNLQPNKLFRHQLKTSTKKDQLIYHEKDIRFFLGCGLSRDQQYIFLRLTSHGTSEWHFIKADQPLTPPKLISKRKLNHEYFVDSAHQNFYIRSNLKHRDQFQIYQCPSQNPINKNWQIFLPYKNNQSIEDYDCFENYFIYNFKQNGLNQIAIGNYSSKKFQTLKFPEPCYEVHLGLNPNFKTNTLRYNYSSLCTPATIFEQNLTTNKTKILKQDKIPSGHNPKNYIVERIYAISHDKVKVPLSIIRKKSTKLNATAPLLMNGYGAYGISIDADFRKQAFSLIDRGFVYVITHPRGGQEMGRQWYENGKLLNKKNTFLDFIACTKTLINKKYCHPHKIFARGGSAGGILMGYLANNAPQLYRGIIAHVPFVDVLNTMFDTTLPLTALEYNEWGNPNEKKYFDYIKSYSPYNNVLPQSYPNLFITGGLNDPRVTYWEPTKWTAKLRATKTDNNLLLLKINMEAGHGGKSGRFEYLKEIAQEYAFIFKILGIKKL